MAFHGVYVMNIAVIIVIIGVFMNTDALQDAGSMAKLDRKTRGWGSAPLKWMKYYTKMSQNELNPKTGPKGRNIRSSDGGDSNTADFRGFSNQYA